MKSPFAKTIVFVATVASLAVLAFFALNTGSIQVTFGQLMSGLFVEFDPDVAAIYDLRFPRIICSVIAGAGIAVSGVMFQAVLKNPVADPSLIGVSYGALFGITFITAFFPALYFAAPFFAIAFGLISFCVVYALSWKGGVSTVRIILIGVAMNLIILGLIEFLQSVTGASQSVSSLVSSVTLSMKTWSDVRTLALFTAVGLLAALLISKRANLLSLSDKTVRSLGVHVDRLRFVVVIIAVVLAAVSSSVIGVITFLGLVVPHIGRLLVGTDNRILVPYCMILGACVLLAADTAGRLIAYPYEVSAGIIMTVVGGLLFIALLRGSKNHVG